MYSGAAAGPPRRDFISVTLGPEEAVGVGGYNNSKAWRRRSCWRVRDTRELCGTGGIPGVDVEGTRPGERAVGRSGAFLGLGATGVSCGTWRGTPVPSQAEATAVGPGARWALLSGCPRGCSSRGEAPAASSGFTSCLNVHEQS